MFLEIESDTSPPLAEAFELATFAFYSSVGCYFSCVKNRGEKAAKGQIWLWLNSSGSSKIQKENKQADLLRQ